MIIGNVVSDFRVDHVSFNMRRKQRQEMRWDKEKEKEKERKEVENDWNKIGLGELKEHSVIDIT